MSLLIGTRRSLLKSDVVIASLPDTSGPGGISSVGLALWLKADVGVFRDLAATTPAGHADPVALWQDQSGNGHHFSQALSESRPFYDANSLNNGPSIAFDATDDTLVNNTLALAAGDRTVIVAFLANDDGDTLQYVLDAQTGRFVCAHLGNGGGAPGFYDGAWQEVGVATTGAQVLTWYFSGSTGTIYRNGVSLGSAAYNPVAIGGAIGLGGEYTQEANGTVLDGLLGDVIVYDRALALGELSTVHEHLTTKYNI